MTENDKGPGTQDAQQEAGRGPVGVRTERAMDRILPLVRAMRRDRGKLAITGLLSDVGSTYERKGPGPAEVLVVGKRNDSAYEDKRDDLHRLVQIIGIMSEEKLPAADGGYILKKLDAIRDYYTPEEANK